MTSTPHIHPDASTRMGKARSSRPAEAFCHLSISLVWMQQVTKEASVHCDLQTSDSSRYTGFPWPSGRGTRESIVHSSLHPLKDPPLVSAEMFIYDGDLIRCESDCVDGLVRSAITYLRACVALFHTPVVVLLILNPTRGNVVGLCGLNAPLTYV